MARYVCLPLILGHHVVLMAEPTTAPLANTVTRKFARPNLKLAGIVQIMRSLVDLQDPVWTMYASFHSHSQQVPGLETYCPSIAKAIIRTLTVFVSKPHCLLQDLPLTAIKLKLHAITNLQIRLERNRRFILYLNVDTVRMDFTIVLGGQEIQNH